MQTWRQVMMVLYVWSRHFPHSMVRPPAPGRLIEGGGSGRGGAKWGRSGLAWQTCGYEHTPTPTHTHTHTRARTHKHTHTNMHASKHTPKHTPALRPASPLPPRPRQRPQVRLNGVVTLRAPWVPFAVLALGVMLGASPWPDVFGVLAGGWPGRDLRVEGAWAFAPPASAGRRRHGGRARRPGGCVCAESVRRPPCTRLPPSEPAD
jgi:hypothetical protein